MTSEEAYTEKFGTFIEWSRDQLQRGKYDSDWKKPSDTDATTG